MLVDLDGQHQPERVSVTRRSDGQSNLPIASTATPGDVNTPDAFADPRAAATPARCASRSARAGATRASTSTTPSTARPAVGALGTAVLADPANTPLYLYRTTTLRWFARCTPDSGPQHAETYTIDQPLQVDSDGDGIPDLYEIWRRQARASFDPLACDADADGDGVSDLEELQRGTAVDTPRACEGGGTPGAVCDSDEDCPFGLCRFTCQGGTAAGQTCEQHVDAPEAPAATIRTRSSAATTFSPGQRGSTPPCSRGCR